MTFPLPEQNLPPMKDVAPLLRLSPCGRCPSPWSMLSHPLRCLHKPGPPPCGLEIKSRIYTETVKISKAWRITLAGSRVLAVPGERGVGGVGGGGLRNGQQGVGNKSVKQLGTDTHFSADVPAARQLAGCLKQQKYCQDSKVTQIPVPIGPSRCKYF